MYHHDNTRDRDAEDFGHAVSAYMSTIGSRGGRKSRRVLSVDDARTMAKKRWERRRSEDGQNELHIRATMHAQNLARQVQQANGNVQKTRW